MNKYTYAIPDANIKWIEKGGAKVIPIFWDLSDEELFSLLGKINGLVIPGSFENLYIPEVRELNPWTKVLYKIFD